MAKRLQRLTPTLVLAAFLAQPAMAQVEGPVTQGLEQLAQQIVAKSKAAGKTAIAVLPFPNADGSCSVLSNFIADELIQSLFSVPGSGLEIIERVQLETLINELRLGASGLLNPETTKQLGSQSGVGALTVGTITVIGDTVRINARLIATDSGKAVSAAAVAIPKVAAVSDLLKQPVTTGPTCAPRTIGAPNEVILPPAPESPAATTTDVLYETGGEKGKFENWPLSADWKHLDDILINDASAREISPILAPYDPKSGSYVVEAEIRANQDRGDAFGFVVRVNGEDGYLIAISLFHDIACIRYLNPKLGRDCLIQKRFRPDTEWHRYRIELRKNTVTLLIDGAITTSLTDNKFLLPGRIGMWAKEAQVEVQSFRIIKL